MKKRYALFSLLLLITAHASAGQYAIHLDTSKVADLSQYEVLRVYGELFTAAATKDYTTTLLGSYESKHLAGETLNSVRQAGYHAAFITKHKNVRSPVPVTAQQQYNEDVAHKDFEKVVNTIN